MDEFRIHCIQQFNQIINSGNTGDFSDECQLFINNINLNSRIKLLINTVTYKSILLNNVFNNCTNNVGQCSMLWDWIYDPSTTKPSPTLTSHADHIISQYCDKYKTDPKCRCVIAPYLLSEIRVNTTQPYYCYYSPCFNTNNYRTSTVRSQQLLCNGTGCNITIGDVTLNNTDLNVVNDCVPDLDIAKYVRTSVENLSPDRAVRITNSVIPKYTSPLYTSSAHFITPLVFLCVSAILGIYPVQ